MLSRRQLLKIGTAGASLTALVAGGGGLVLARWWDRPSAEGYRCLSSEEAGFLNALAEVTWPATSSLALGGREAMLDHYVDELVNSMPSTVAKQLRLLLHVLDALPRPRHMSAFQHLSAETREQVMFSWMNSDLAEIRSAATSVVLFLGMGYTTHPDNAQMFSRMYGCGYGR